MLWHMTLYEGVNLNRWANPDRTGQDAVVRVVARASSSGLVHTANHRGSDNVDFGQLLQFTTPDQIGAAAADVRANETAFVRQACSTHG
jgi:hypothetical protein